MSSEVSSVCESAWEETFALAMSDDSEWKLEKTGPQGEQCLSKKNNQGRKVGKIRMRLDVNPDMLITKFAGKDSDKDDIWSEFVKESKVLETLNSSTKVIYQEMHPVGPGGVISARDFVLVMKSDFKDKEAKVFVNAGCSIDHAKAPKNTKCIRATNGPSGQVIRAIDEKTSELIHVMDSKYNGWLPAKVLDLAMPQAQLQFVDCMRRLADKLNNQQ